MTDRFQSRKRFSNRVADYVKFRPSYPAAVLDFARDELSLTPEDVVADIGSGTGIFTELLLDRGNRVLAIEPNAQMRLAAEESLDSTPGFRSVAGSAEETTLPDDSIDLITAAQAFHWFDLPRVRAEFVRILRAPGRVMLVWNDRKPGGTPFLKAYEDFLQSDLTEYRQVGMHSRQVGENLAAFFDAGSMIERIFPSEQKFDISGLLGRAFSSSYVPAPGQPGHPEARAELERIFKEHNTDGFVTMEYETKVYAGNVTAKR